MSRMIRMIVNMTVTLALAMLAATCGKNKADFGFKGPQDDSYRRIDGALEIPAGNEMMWVYSFENRQPDRTIGIIYQKKEAVWVEVMTTSVRVNDDNRAVYGTIRDLPAGSYRLIITDVNDNNYELVSKEFAIYQKDEGEEEE